MPAIAFDTLAFARKLRGGGFTDQQAEVRAQAQAELFEQNLATKLDLKELERTIKEVEVSLRREMKEIEANLRREMKEIETNSKRDLKELEAKLTRDMKDLEYRMVIKLGSLMLAGITVVATLVKLL